MLAFTLQRYTGALASACRRSLSSKAVALPTLSTTGVLHSPSFRMDYFSNEKDQVSPWHDIPLYSADQKGTVNFLCEIPRCTTAKMEVDTKSRFNPIVQDVKNGEPRFYHGPIYWNYGCLPQTWEDPNVKDDIVGCFGDNDPLDVVEIGTEECEMGGIYSVKPLCVLSIVLPDGKLPNSFGHDERALSALEAFQVIKDTHIHWKELVARQSNPGKLWLPDIVED